MKRILSMFTLLVFMMTAFSSPVFADDNATSGDGETESAKDGYGYYRESEFLWKVTLFVGKSDEAYKYSSLTSDFYRVGTVIMKRTGWSVSSSVQFGAYTKVDYYNGTSLSTSSGVNIISDSNCPLIPIACGGNLNTVKSYFGSTGTLNTVLNAIASQSGTSAYGLLSSKRFTIGGTSQSGWESSYLLPNGTTNRVPWVIVYEPMVIMHLKDKVTKLAFTATEFALAQKYGWYDWHYSSGSGQAVDKLTHQHLPTSVQLEESWFGYPVYSVTSDSVKWSDDDIIRGGGWGMRWLDAAEVEIEVPIEPDDTIYPETSEYNVGVVMIVDSTEASLYSYGNVTAYWLNQSSDAAYVLCEIYYNGSIIWSDYLLLSGYEVITQTYSIYYSYSGANIVEARINYENRYYETNSNDNLAVQLINVSEGTYGSNFGCLFSQIPTVEAYNYGLVEVIWLNWTTEQNVVLCELYQDGNLIWSEYMFFTSNEAKIQTFSIYFTDSTSVISAQINYPNLYSETDPNDNYAGVLVSPTVPIVSNYDFSVSNLTVTPSEINQDESVTISFRTDNWDQAWSYVGIPIEVFFNGSVIYAESANYDVYGVNIHSIGLTVGNIDGDIPIEVRINWDNRFMETNSNNNYAATTLKVNASAIDLGNEYIPPNSEYREGTDVVTSFNIFNYSDTDITPSMGNTVSFEAYYLVNGTKAILSSQIWQNAVIPANNQNLVYFKWHVPQGTKGKTVYCEAIVNSQGEFNESDLSNNKTTLITTIEKYPSSQTPDTLYEREKPTGFTVPNVPNEATANATWTMWEYVNGEFVIMTYGVELSDVKPSIVPDSSIVSSEVAKMKSGYGYTINYLPSIVSMSGYSSPETNAVTYVQTVYAYFPEFGYSDANNKHRVLSKHMNAWQFEENEYTELRKRIHFTPIWYPDTEYYVLVKASDIWTPAGMIEADVKSNAILIQDAAYDDWYVGR